MNKSKYLIRIFTDIKNTVFKEYSFDTLPYMPKKGEYIYIDNICYLIKDIYSSFDECTTCKFMIEYIVQEIEGRMNEIF